MAWTREQKNAYERERYRQAHPPKKRGRRPKVIIDDGKPILPQKPFSALFTEFFY